MRTYHEHSGSLRKVKFKLRHYLRFTIGHDNTGQTEEAIAELQRKIVDGEKCIATYERQTRRPLGTDFGCLTNVSWGNWSAHNG